MKIKLPTHEGLIIDNFTYKVIKTVDYPIAKQFKPVILITADNIKIMHDCETVDYVNETWTDEDVVASVGVYLKTLEVNAD